MADPTPAEASMAATTTDPRTDAEIEADLLRETLAHGEEREPDAFPSLYNLSAGFMFRFIPRPPVPTPAEYVYVPLPRMPRRSSRWQGPAGEARLKVELAIAQWNAAWEADHLRHEMFADQLPAELGWLRRYEDRNIALVPDGEYPTRYDACAPLYHLLPLRTLDRFGLPAIRRGMWPVTMSMYWHHAVLPHRADERLGQAFAAHVWPLLVSGSQIGAFDASDPLRLLAHSLDFWLPYADRVAGERLRQYPRCEYERPADRVLLRRHRREVPAGYHLDRPLMGGPIWEGEAEAWEATRAVVDTADAHGHLRAILDAIRSHRVEEDFSPRWPRAREDFERRLYRKRNKVRVTFVELTDPVSVHGPDAEVHESLLWEDFFAVLDPKERRVVVCLRRGLTHRATSPGNSGTPTTARSRRHSPGSARRRRGTWPSSFGICSH